MTGDDEKLERFLQSSKFYAKRLPLKGIITLKSHFTDKKTSSPFSHSHHHSWMSQDIRACCDSKPSRTALLKSIDLDADQRKNHTDHIFCLVRQQSKEMHPRSNREFLVRLWCQTEKWSLQLYLWIGFGPYKKGTFDSSRNLIRNPSGNFNQA